MQSMYYVGLDVHKKTISYCVVSLLSPELVTGITRVKGVKLLGRKIDRFLII